MDMAEVQRDWTQVSDDVLEPLLLHKPCGETTYHYFHPLFKKKIDSKDFVEQVSDAVPRFYNKGWILMSSGWNSFFFFNPSTNTVIHLPDFPLGYDFSGMTFSLTPTSSGCVVVGTSGYFPEYVTFSRVVRGDDRWNFCKYDNNIPIQLSHCNPLLHNEMVYCLGKKGHLAVLNPKEDSWTVLSDLPIPCKERDLSQGYLVTYENKLVGVFLGQSRSWISVLKLDESKMAWEEVNDLGDYALFLSPPTSFARKDVGDIMKNKIFLPIFCDNYMVFYSLETRKFHTFGNNLCKESLEGTEVAEQLESCWIEAKAPNICSPEVREQSESCPIQVKGQIVCSWGEVTNY